MVTGGGGHQQMNQAGSENKCSKSASHECVLNNYNYDDVSTDQNSICENCKQGRLSASAHGKHSSNVGSVCNTEHVVGVAEVCSREGKSRLQPDASNSFEQSLLQKAWIYLQSIINSHMTACPRCNPRPSPNDESPKQSTTKFFRRSMPSAATPSILSSCHNNRPMCSRTVSPCHNARPSCSRPPPPCPKFESPSPKASCKYSICHKSCLDSDSLSDPPSPKSAYPDTKSRLNSSANLKSSYHKDCYHSPFDTSIPNAIPPRLKAMPPRPNYKASLHHSVSKDSLSDSSYTNRQSLCPKTESACPYAIPNYSNSKPVYPNSKPVCPNSKPVCPNSKPVCPKSKPVCPNSKPVCPNSKPVCPHSKPVCPNSKTRLYHSFSNDSLPSSCKESLVEMAKVYLEKLTSDHKMKCALCAKQGSYYSLETISSYLRGMMEQAWNYIKTDADQNSVQSQRSQSICSNAFKKQGVLKLPSSTKSKCSCATSKQKITKARSFESEGHRRSIKCPSCLTPITWPKAARINFAPGLTKHYDDDADEYEEPSYLDQRSEEEGTHEHKSCNTRGCMHNSRSAQPSFTLSNTSCWSSKSCAKPVFIKSRQIKTPQSVEELKASVTGITDKSSRMFYGSDVLDLRSTIEYSRPCLQDWNVSKELISLPDEPTPKLVLNLTMEQNDVGSRPKESNYSKQSLDNCKKFISPCSDLEEQISKEEALCPNQSSSEGSRKSEAVNVQEIGEESGSILTNQLSNKDTICQAGHNSSTCFETIQVDGKGKESVIISRPSLTAMNTLKTKAGDTHIVHGIIDVLNKSSRLKSSKTAILVQIF